MGLDDFISIPLWKRYTKKMVSKILRPSNSGHFQKEEAEARQMRLIVGITENKELSCKVSLYWLVDPTDGILVDAKFQMFGASSLIAVIDATCDLLVGKNINQVKRITSELIDKQLRDKSDTTAFPEEVTCYLNLSLEAIENAIEECQGLPFLQNYATPLPREENGEKEKGGYPGWLELSREQKLSVIEEVFSQEIRPYIELDSGGIEILDLIGDKELIVSYQGACTSCFSSVGATLSTIQQIVQDKIHPELIVVPNLDDLKF